MEKSYVFKWKQHSIIPGFGLSLGFTVMYLGFIILLPLSMIFIHSMVMDWGEFWEPVTEPRVIASYRLSFSTAFTAALINAVFGLLISWVLVRYEFPGKRLLDGLVDLPFALPTAVAGIALTTLYAPNGWVGQFLNIIGVQAAFTPLGIVIALTFIGLPFVVRMVQPVLQNLEKEVEEAAVSLVPIAGKLSSRSFFLRLPLLY